MSDASLTGTLTVKTLSFWHAGGGLGGDFGADAVVRKEDGLPIVPGRHLLGLIAHKLKFLTEISDASGVTPQLCDFLRGAGADDEAKNAKTAGAKPVKTRHRFTTTSGALLIDSARLSEAWMASLINVTPAQRALKTAPLYRRFGTTALQDGVAKDRTLRHIEVTVPMTLSADLQIDLDRGDSALRGDVDPKRLRRALEQAVGLVQHIGRHRTRGLGRARLSIQWGTP